MSKEDAGIEPVKTRWCIDLDWYDHNKRSFPALVGGYLCPKCQGKLKGEITAEVLLASIKGCCGKSSGFISAGLPILESVFRIFLANGNQPLDVEELSRQMRLNSHLMWQQGKKLKL